MGAVAVLLAAVLAPLHLENYYFVAFYQWINHFGHYLCATYCGRSYSDGSVVVQQQNLVKLNRLAFLRVTYVIDKELLALFSLELLTVDFYNCVHFIFIV